MTSQPPEPWVKYNPLTDMYETPDNTHVPAILVDSVDCLADVLHIAFIRDRQRAEIGASL